MIFGTFTVLPPSVFLTHRDNQVARCIAEGDNKKGIDDLYRRWDSEFPEWHQCFIDPKQTLFEGNETLPHHAFDTIDEDYDNCDYKIYAKKGIHLTNYIYNKIKEGTTDHVVVWQWADGNRHKRLYINEEVSYTILGVVPASYIIKTAKVEGYDKHGRPYYRFPYEKGVKYV
jgi:hypothetical protein